MQYVEQRDIAGEPDREHGKNDVEADSERELKPRKFKCGHGLGILGVAHGFRRLAAAELRNNSRSDLHFENPLNFLT